MRIRLIVLAMVAVLAAACGGESGDETASESETSTAPASAGDDAGQGSDAGPDQPAEPTEPAESPAPPPGDSGAIYAVDGEPYGGDLYNCDPSDGAGDGDPGDLELVVRSGSSEGLSIDVWHTERQGPDGTFFQQQRVEVRLNRTGEEYTSLFDHDADGNWTTDGDRTATLDGPPATVDGDHMVGAAILVQDFPQDATGTVAVTFDFEIPELSC